MSDTQYLERELERISNTSNARIQSGQISSLVQTVSTYVQQIKEEEALVKQISQFKRTVHNDNDSPDGEKEAKEAAELLNKAQAVERHIGEKRNALRQLEREVQVLLQEIKRG